MSSTEHDELKHASEMLAKLQAHHRARADELNTACEVQRECTRARLAELAAIGKRTAKAIPGSSYVRDGQTMVATAAS